MLSMDIVYFRMYKENRSIYRVSFTLQQHCSRRSHGGKNYLKYWFICRV